VTRWLDLGVAGLTWVLSRRSCHAVTSQSDREGELNSMNEIPRLVTDRCIMAASLSHVPLQGLVSSTSVSQQITCSARSLLDCLIRERIA
jgi:hypothetical protein